MKKIINKAVETANLEKNEIISLLENKQNINLLFEAANFIRKKNVGDGIHLRALIEISSVCKNSCLYCGLRAPNKKNIRYSMSFDEIKETASKAVNVGMQTIVLQSGESDVYSIDEICQIIAEIKKLNVAVTLSFGEKTFEEYKQYKTAGADRYLLRIETTDNVLYKKLHPAMSFENRIQCLKNLKQLKYEVGTGGLVGLPEQSISSIANDILFYKKINADMIGIGPFISHPDTPLKKVNNGDFYLTLKVIAICRLLLPSANIPATTAMETILPNGRNLALCSGANVIMPNFTNEELRNKYCIYPNKTGINVSTEDSLEKLKRQISEIGRFVIE